MNEKYLYLTLDFLTIIFPFLFSFYSREKFYKKWKFAWIAIFIPAILFVVWDSWFTTMGIWGFNSRYLTGIYFINLPIEEVLFFVCIPYACLFTYEAKRVLSSRDRLSPGIQYGITDGLSVIFLVIGVLHYDRWYTVTTMLFAALLLVLLRWVWKVKFLERFYVTLLFILIPFLLVNGILTGTWIDEPVVWYNNAENMGFRVGTIPIEDAVYGMVLILLNVSLFEYGQKKAPTQVEASS